MNQQIPSTQETTMQQESILNNPIVSIIGKVVLSVIVVIFLILISKGIALFIRKKIIKSSLIESPEDSSKIGNLIGDIVFYILLTFSIFIGFEILGIDLSIFFGGLSFGIGLAFKETLGNMIAGILILTTKEFTLGDIIKVEGDIEYFGKIEEITIRYTIIREFNNQKVIIPNLTLITSPIKTFTTEEFVRLETTVQVHYNTDLDKAKKIITETIKQLPFVVNKDQTTAITNEFSNSGINIKAWFYIDPNGDTSGPVAISKVNDAIKKAFDKYDINIPYPHTTITVDKNDQNLLKTLLFFKKNNLIK